MEKYERFKAALDYIRRCGLFKSKAELSRIMSRSYTSVVSACNGSGPEFNDSFLADFARHFPHISASWLLTGEGEMLTQAQPTSVSVPADLLGALYSELRAVRQELAEVRSRLTALEAKRTTPRSYRATTQPLSIAAEP